MAISDLSFERADFSAERPAASCVWCTRGLGADYFDVQGARVCSVCAGRAREHSPADTRAAFVRSVLFGMIAAGISGLAYFSLCRLPGGEYLMFTSIGVGYVIGKAMRAGSNGVGGRRYQVMAAVLTYAAVVIASSAAILGTRDVPVWAYPFMVLVPVVSFFAGHSEMGGLQIMLVALGIRWAWSLMAGAPWRISGPHPLDEQMK
jgi:hypothetical protein